MTLSERSAGRKWNSSIQKLVRLYFNVAKRKFPRNITFPYYNPKASTILQTDASKKRIGAVLLQNSTPVMFASRALTGSERNYQNLECECLATIWGMEKFHYFLYGKEFTLETDQKPLVSICETYGGNFSKDPEIDSEKLPISTFQCAVQERSGNSTSRCSQ